MGKGRGTLLSAAAALGPRVERAWHDAHRDERAFVDVALGAVESFEPPRFDMREVTRFLLRTRTAQRTEGGRVFSDMPVTVFRGDGFYIELLIWMDGTTTVHQHAFSGAFRVIEGSSLHSTYAFEETRRINARTRVGRVHCRGMEYLGRGDCRGIKSGREGLAHALFHLDRPSVTLVVRTNSDPDATPQHNLYAPGLAIDPHSPDRLAEPLRRWFAILGGVRSGATLTELIVDEIFELDFGRFARFVLSYPEVGAVLSHRTPLQRVLGEPGPYLKRVIARFGAELTDVLMRATLEAQRADSLRKLRRAVVDPDLRLFLALLLNGRSRSQVFGALRARNPRADPGETCAAALERLSSMSGEPEYAEMGTQAPWIAEIRELMERRGGPGAAVARRIAAGRWPEGTDERAARTVEDAVARIAAAPALQALTEPGPDVQALTEPGA